jgi:hypothetical protein
MNPVAGEKMLFASINSTPALPSEGSFALNESLKLGA